jgi:hypothetical protein
VDANRSNDHGRSDVDHVWLKRVVETIEAVALTPADVGAADMLALAADSLCS